MTTGKRIFKLVQFETSSDDEAIIVPITEGGASGSFSVYARKVSGAGSATLAVSGSFKSDPASNDLITVQAATSVGTGAMENILGASEDNRFPYLELDLARTGEIAVDVFVTVF